METQNTKPDGGSQEGPESSKYFINSNGLLVCSGSTDDLSGAADGQSHETFGYEQQGGGQRSQSPQREQEDGAVYYYPEESDSQYNASGFVSLGQTAWGSGNGTWAGGTSVAAEDAWDVTVKVPAHRYDEYSFTGTVDVHPTPQVTNGGQQFQFCAVARNVRNWPGLMAPEPQADPDTPGSEGSGSGSGSQGASGGSQGSSLAAAYEAPSFEPAHVREQQQSYADKFPGLPTASNSWDSAASVGGSSDGSNSQ